MTALRVAIAFLIAILGCACGDPSPTREWTPADHGQPAQPDDARDPEAAADDRPPEDPTVRAARALWNATCASCHARDGRGGGPGLPPGAQVPDLTADELQTSRSDQQLAAVIRDGRNLMPAFGEQVNADGIRALVAHIRRLGAAAAPAPGGAKATGE